jgi:hypothetical protein
MQGFEQKKCKKMNIHHFYGALLPTKAILVNLDSSLQKSPKFQNFLV